MSPPTNPPSKDKPTLHHSQTQTRDPLLPLPKPNSFPYMEAIDTEKKKRAGYEEADFEQRLAISLGQTSKEDFIHRPMPHGMPTVKPTPDFAARINEVTWGMMVKAEEELRKDLVAKAQEVSSEDNQ